MANAETIYKYPLAVVDQQTLRLPKGAEILSVQVQGDTPCLWARVTPDAPLENRDIRVHGTGHRLPGDAALYDHIGTVQLLGGSLVFHVFEAGAA